MSSPDGQSAIPMSFMQQPFTSRQSQSDNMVSQGMPVDPSSQQMAQLKFDSGPTHRTVMSTMSQLPTPHSPTNLGYYLAGAPSTPESPVPISMSSSSSSFPMRRYNIHAAVNPPSQQTMTPESSPYMPRTGFSDSRQAKAPAFDSPLPPIQSISLDFNRLGPHRTPPPMELAPLPSLSSPFMARQSTNDNSNTPRAHETGPRSVSPMDYQPTDAAAAMEADRAFFLSSSTAVSSGATRPAFDLTAATSAATANALAGPPEATANKAPGGELERLHQQRLHEQLTQIHDVESRRPDYLKRMKRTFSEAGMTEPSSSFSTGIGSALMGAFGSTATVDDEERYGSVGITDSPNKGRRLKLFQETSEESFEESLMAGGYGRYRTAEWVRQPQPVPLALTTPLAPGHSQGGPSDIISILDAEAANAKSSEPPAPPTEKELRKRKRLAAFRSSGHDHGYDFAGSSRLFPVEIEGKGRVLLDIPNTELLVEGAAAAAILGNKKRGQLSVQTASLTASGSGNKRRKKTDPSAKDRRSLAASGAVSPTDDIIGDRPNWPDAEFPWKLRSQEMRDAQRLEEKMRMTWITKFFDRDTDDEDDGEDSPIDTPDDDEVIPSAKWGVIYEDGIEGPLPARHGRGKIVPLAGDPNAHNVEPRWRPRAHVRRHAYFPSDPADARAALLSKRSVRALSYRQQRRLREAENNSDEEVVCICRGKDDGRQLVQCDSCKMWFHLKCIGLRMAELGREEDPWFCRDCVPDPMSEPSDDESPPLEQIARDPIFAPTDETPTRRSSDVPFFQLQESTGMQDSPIRGVRTPPRRSRQLDYDSSPLGSYGPRTPRSYGGPSDGYAFLGPTYDDGPFDPNATPSRGVKFTGTPKGNGWSSKLLMQKSFGGPGFLSSMLDDTTVDLSLMPRMSSYDDSPIRRDEPKPRRILEPTTTMPLEFTLDAMKGQNDNCG